MALGQGLNVNFFRGYALVHKERSITIIQQISDHLTSLRLTIFLLLILAVVSIFGTIIPQSASPQEYLKIYRLSTYKILRILGFLDMYHAPWYFFLLALLSLNLIFCSWKRFKNTWKLFTASFPQDESSWLKLSPRCMYLTGSKEEEVLLKIKRVWAKSLPSLKVQRAQNILFLSGEKGRLSQLGVYFIHLGILIILAGALIGFYGGFRGQVNVKEGEKAERIFLKNGQEIFFPEFTIRLEKFSVSFYPSGAPREFKSIISIFEKGQKMLTAPILVNQPLSYKGINFYQASYGIVSLDKVILEIEDLQTGQRFITPAFLGKQSSILENSLSLRLNRFIPNFQDLGPALLINISSSPGFSENFWLFLNHPNFSAGEKGKRWQVRVKEWFPIYYSGLQVTKDPGVEIVWIGCAFMIGGFYLTFLIAHRRLWMRLYAQGNGFSLEIVAFTNRDRQKLEEELNQIERAWLREASTSNLANQTKGDI